MNLLTIIIIFVILGFGILGAYRGLVRTALSLVSIVVSIILVYIFAPMVSDYIIDHTNLDDKLYKKTYKIYKKH